jgi:predicted transcriptional regulator
MALKYTEDQLKEINRNLGLISINAIKVLEAVVNSPGISHSDIPDKSGVSKFVADKCIAGYLISGMITRVDDGVKRFYNITDDGENLIKINVQSKGEK